MTKELYQQRLYDLQKQYLNDRDNIMKEFALANNPYKIDDIVTDHIGSLTIKKISFYLTEDAPQCIFTGIELKKDLTPVKKQTGRAVYQSNITGWKHLTSEHAVRYENPS